MNIKTFPSLFLQLQLILGLRLHHRDSHCIHRVDQQRFMYVAYESLLG